MPGATAKGIPYSLNGDDAPTIDDTMQDLAEFLDGLMTAMTTAARDLLAAGLRWDGRIIFNTTTRRHEWWDAVATTWKPLLQDADDAFLFSIL